MLTKGTKIIKGVTYANTDPDCNWDARKVKFLLNFDSVKIDDDGKPLFELPKRCWTKHQWCSNTGADWNTLPDYEKEIIIINNTDTLPTQT